MHSLNNGITICVDDCALLQSVPLALGGRVVDGTGAGVDGATVSATSTGWTPANTTTAGGGYYTFNVPPGIYTVTAAKALYNPGSTSATVSNGFATAPNITITPVPTAVVSGTVTKLVGGSPVGVAGVVVSANYASGPPSISAPSAANGAYSVVVVVGAQVSLSASAANEILVSQPAPFIAPSTNSISGKNFQLADVPQSDQLLFAVVTESLPSSGSIAQWLTWNQTINPSATAPLPFVPIGGAVPTAQEFGGVNWEQNYYNSANGSGFRLEDPSVVNDNNKGEYTSPIPLGTGATVVLATKPKRTGTSDAWDTIVDVFFNQLALGVRNDNGQIMVGVNDNSGSVIAQPNNIYFGPSIPDGQTTIISLVVSNSGQFLVYTNGTLCWTNSADLPNTLAYTQLTPGARTAGNTASFASYIDIGREDPDGWSAYSGFIGDVFVYTNALADVDRRALESSLMAKFITNATFSYTITASAGANGSISPAGAVSVVQGYNQTFTATANLGYIVTNIMVDGVWMGSGAAPSVSYTFTNVNANHTISAAFGSLPPQTITASAAAGGTISPSGSVVVTAGYNQTFVMTPNYGYAVSNVVVDSVSQGEVYSYTFTGVVAPHTISVTFRPLPMPVPQPGNLLFSVQSSNCQSGGVWPAYVPAGSSLTPIGTPSTAGNWESNPDEGDGYKFFGGVYGPPSSTIAMNGGTIVVACQPTLGMSANAYQCLVSVFLNQFSICVDRSSGDVSIGVQAGAFGPNIDTGVALSSGASYVLSLVVEPAGGATLYVNGSLAWIGTTPALTSISPQAWFNVDINVGKGWEGDNWSSFIGLIGDVFVYKSNLSDSDRRTLETSLAAEFGITMGPTYYWSGPNNGNWSGAANWNNSVPGPGNIAIFSYTNTAGATVQLDGPVSVDSLLFNNLVPNTTIASSSGNTLTLTKGDITVDAGTQFITAAVDATAAGLTVNGPGVLNIGGTLTSLTPNANYAISPIGAGGQVVLSGSWTDTTTAYNVIGNSSGTSILTINSPATLDWSGNWAMVVAWGDNGTGIVVQNGGTVKTPPVGTAWFNNNGPGLMLGSQGSTPSTAEYRSERRHADHS